MTKSVTIKNGIFFQDDHPKFVISGDYPYYRDDPQNWEDRLRKIKQGGIDVVTFYIPWRHHFIKFNEHEQQECDFTGSTQSNRNVLLFIELAQKIGLYVCVKPGPFIHAETNYGGLPEFVNPEINPKIQSFRNFLAMEGKQEQSVNRWGMFFGKPLPSPMDPEFLKLTKEYFRQIAITVLKGRMYPEGPIILVQILNEGLYSEGRTPFSYSGDYTTKNIRNFQRYLARRYQNIAHYNYVHHSNHQKFSEISPPGIYEGRKKYAHFQNLKNAIDWDDYGVEYYAMWVNALKKELIEGSNTPQFVPLVANWNPEGDFGQGLDVWATRVNVEKIRQLADVHYGYTNWIGAVNYRRSSYLRYGLLCQRANGINMEENWGFGKIYDWYYTYGFTPLFQTLLAIASGCTGYNIYTAVGTAHWDADLDSNRKVPYPSDSPITENGTFTNKFFIMAGLNKFFGEYFGPEFFECKQDTLLSLGLYQPYVSLAAFAGHNPKLWTKLGAKSGPMFGMDCLAQLQLACRRLKISYQIKNLESCILEKNPATQFHRVEEQYPELLIFSSLKPLNQGIQNKLLHYVEQGGILCLFGEIPELNEQFEPCTILLDAIKKNKANPQDLDVIGVHIGKGALLFQSGSPFMRHRGLMYYITHLLVRFLMHIRLRLPRKKFIEGKLLPYAEIVGIISSTLFGRFGGGTNESFLRLENLQAITGLLRVLHERGIYRQLDVQIRTIYKYRRNIDVFIYYHPTLDIQYIFIFSIGTNQNLPVAITYFFPERKRSVRVNTIIVGATSQLLRIKESKLDSFIYTGVNPVSRRGSALSIKVNNLKYRTDAPVDLIYLNNLEKKELYVAHMKRSPPNLLYGCSETPILLKNGSLKLA